MLLGWDSRVAASLSQGVKGGINSADYFSFIIPAAEGKVTGFASDFLDAMHCSHNLCGLRVLGTAPLQVLIARNWRPPLAFAIPSI
jgi:hypothetical protein